VQKGSKLDISLNNKELITILKKSLTVHFSRVYKIYTLILNPTVYKGNNFLRKSLLVIDDNEKLCRSLCRNFERQGYATSFDTTGTDIKEIIDRFNPKTILLDISLKDKNGLEILREIKEYRPNIPVIMITGFGTIETAIESIREGAFDYIQKPLEFNKLLVIIENAIKMNLLDKENQSLKKRITRLSPRIVTENPRMLEIFDKAKRLAGTDFPLLIQGESGTGKEGMAEYIHQNSTRVGADFLKINCAAFPENLLDNELFGHEKGAYTGAESLFRGVFEKADGGTLLLDEIGDMTLATQAKILRTLQNNEIRRIGSEKTIKIDVRFIASSNKDLKSLIQKQLFREDLYYRLTTATITLPPLRERKNDIPLLVDTFLQEFYSQKGDPPKTCTEGYYQRLIDYHWPGNIRELKNVVHYSGAISLKSQITPEDLPPLFLENSEGTCCGGLIQENERDLIIKTLQKTNNNKKRAAEMLQVSRKTLYNKLEKYGI